MQFRQPGKFTPKYINPYSIIERVGGVAYRLQLPEELSKVHNVFHVSQLCKYIFEPTHVIKWKPLQLWEGLNYKKQLMRFWTTKRSSFATKWFHLWKSSGVTTAQSGNMGNWKKERNLNILIYVQDKVRVSFGDETSFKKG